MNDPFPVLLERYLLDDLDDAGCATLQGAIAQDATLREEFLLQAAMSRRIGAVMHAPSAEDTWSRIALVIRSNTPSHRQRTALEVAARISQRQPRRSAFGPAALTALAAGLLVAILGVVWMQAGRSGDPGAIAVVAAADPLLSIIRAARRLPAGVGTALHAGDRLADPANAASIRFLDGTQVDIAVGSSVRLVAGQSARDADQQKRLLIEHGMLTAVVSKQPKDRPLVISSPYGQATVVGTILRLEVDQQARRGMRLEVIEGRVELGNVAGASVMVDSGQSAIAATGIPLVVEAIGRSPGGAAATAAAISAPYAHAGTWEDVTPAGIDLSPDFPSASQNYGVQDVLADPRHPGTFYAFVCYQGCWRSVDWGSSWTHISSDGHLEQGRPWGEAMAPDGSYMLATTGYGPAGAWRSTDQGRSWANIGMGPHGVPEMFDVEPGNADHAVASFHAEDAISESQDGGRTWVDKGPAGTGPASYVFILTPTSWLAIGQIGNHAVGTRRTVDAGASWNPVGPMEHALGNEQIAIDTKNGTIYAPGLGTYRSSDGGASFTKVSTINGSAIFATASAIYSLDGGATNAFNQPFFCSSPRADGATWTAAPTPAAMTNGCKRAAVAFDAARGHWVVVTGNWLAGIWRFVEK